MYRTKLFIKLSACQLKIIKNIIITNIIIIIIIISFIILHRFL